MSTDSHTLDRRTESFDDPGLCVHFEPDPDGTTCTMYPPDVSAHEWTTTWISADAGSYVTLSEMR
ncbi:DUF7511 domain-containing protein [Haloglomus salinum]|jgi:hypothetical protein|uniref:DUF7511 domain-containing protein n=1 Tax=Haloglomus salinum TaxID=2962673 RepID=UPI0020C9E242|nr:hypothetical protein [Haloglomus salinum]